MGRWEAARSGVAVAGRGVARGRQNRGMLIVHVSVHVAPDRVPDFLAATQANATASLEEPGVLRFDVVADLADHAHIVLVEVYRDEAGAAAHKETTHYATWRDTVAPMMAVPRTSTKFAAVFPEQDSRWATTAP